MTKKKVNIHRSGDGNVHVYQGIKGKATNTPTGIKPNRKISKKEV